VPSAITAATAEAPQAALMAGPGSRAGGEVMLPWAKTVLTSNAAAAENEVARIANLEITGQ
jgi:hypothetical protein